MNSELVAMKRAAFALFFAVLSSAYKVDVIDDAEKKKHEHPKFSLTDDQPKVKLVFWLVDNINSSVYNGTGNKNQAKQWINAFWPFKNVVPGRLRPVKEYHPNFKRQKHFVLDLFQNSVKPPAAYCCRPVGNGLGPIHTWRKKVGIDCLIILRSCDLYLSRSSFIFTNISNFPIKHRFTSAFQLVYQ